MLMTPVRVWKVTTFKYSINIWTQLIHTFGSPWKLAPTSSGKPTISFLDINNTVLVDGRIEVSAHRKTTHTNKYLSFDSHGPANSKKAVVKALPDHAKCLPSRAEHRHNKEQHVIGDMKINGYPTKFHRENLRHTHENGAIGGSSRKFFL